CARWNHGSFDIW
nr:immunoglobulin heavy chain junction region [Macaca mulatta]MOW23114.1 immunoglobulin heavy chain junction region [Macaca mulatta]MOW23118.1 immunoglobulin heavy chain junction region [Macaca mulatta]MOW23119.1 immunoglobulin heavy chain junction region [Macaca mulatta]MOW23132.1 immunoglobulin heavy chain junction region [Macaca mulatta]